MRIDDLGNSTQILIMKAERKMTGKYTLTSKNEHGEDVAEVEITVLGKILVG